MRYNTAKSWRPDLRPQLRAGKQAKTELEIISLTRELVQFNEGEERRRKVEPRTRQSPAHETVQVMRSGSMRIDGDASVYLYPVVHSEPIQ